jgi:hypothetical protein
MSPRIFLANVWYRRDPYFSVFYGPGAEGLTIEALYAAIDVAPEGEHGLYHR